MNLRTGILLPLLLLTSAAAWRVTRDEEPFQARFALRGRWPGERVIPYRLESASGPVAPAEFARAIRAALDEWAATGCATFRAARADETPALVFAWARGAHGDCVPFGSDPSVAHAGPVGPGTFVHFDAGRPWGAELSLRQAALHEIGHVLGLDHSPDEEAVMYAEPSLARAHLAPSDLAGIHALYGGGERARGDLVVTAGTAEFDLPALAPPELCAWTLFDTDGDGATELVTWRTDAAGQGALWSYHFAPGPLLERTLGPLYGVIAPGLAPEFQRTASGERLLLLRPEHGEPLVRAFDTRGIPQPFAGAVPPEPGPHSPARQADLDGDGTLETVLRRE